MKNKDSEALPYGNTLILKLGGQVVYRCGYTCLPFSYIGGKSGQK